MPSRFITTPAAVTAIRYDSRDSANHTEIIDLVGAANVAWFNNGVLKVRSMGAIWLAAHHGDWVAVDGDQQPHVFTQATVDAFFEEMQ